MVYVAEQGDDVLEVRMRDYSPGITKKKGRLTSHPGRLSK